jgi:hypothetical protein
VERPSICDILPSEPSKKLEPDATITRPFCRTRPRRRAQKRDAQRPDAQKPVYPESSCDGEQRNRKGAGSELKRRAQAFHVVQLGVTLRIVDDGADRLIAELLVEMGRLEGVRGDGDL